MSISLTAIIIFFTLLVVLYPIIRRAIKLFSYSLDKGIDASSRASYVGNEYVSYKLARKLDEINKSSSDINKDIWKEFEKEYKNY